MAGKSSLGTAWIQIKPSLDGITNDLKRELAGAEADAATSSNKISGIFSGLGNNLKSVFSGVGKVAISTFKVAGTAATAAFGGIGASAISAYADWEQLYGGIETLFKDSVGTIDQYAQNAYKTAGLSANQYMEQVTSFSASLLQSLGNDTAKATQYADQAIIDMSDNANKMGTDMQHIQDAYQGFAKQNFTMLDNLKLGYGGTKTEMERLLKDAEEISGMKFSIDSFADITQAIHVIQDHLGITGTTAKEAEETISGSLNQVKASWRNLLAFMGGGTTMSWEKIFPAFVDSIKTLSRNLEPVIQSVATSIGGLFGEIAPLLIKALPTLVDGLVSTIQLALPPILEVLPNIISSIVDAIVLFLSNEESIGSIIDGFVKLFVAVAAGAGRIVSALLPMLPGIIGQIIGSLAEELSKPENALPIISGLGILLGATTLKTVGSNLAKNLKQHIGGVFIKFFQKDVGGEVAQKAGSSIKSVATSISSAITGIADTISTTIKGLGSILISIIGAVMEPLKALLKGVGEALNGFFTALADPIVALGAAIFVVAAAAIAAAIFLIGSAIGAIMPTLVTLFNEILMPFATFMVDTVLVLIDAITNQLINFTNAALIPLGTFLLTSFLLTVDSVTNAIINLTQNGVIPLINTLSGAFTNVLMTVASIINNTLRTALDGITNIIDKVGEGFTRMGGAIRNALDGVNGILSTFRDLIASIADAVVAVVALATGQSIDYGYGFAHISKAATGGRVIGLGSDTSDSNLYALSNGEYVIRAAAARQIGYDNLDELNKTGGLSGRTVNCQITIDGYNKDPEELATIISRKIALREQGVY